MVAYLKKNYPDTDSTFYSFFPLIFVADIFDYFSTGDDRVLVYALEKEIEKRVNYSKNIKDSTSFDDCPMLKMAWGEGIWSLYTDTAGQNEVGINKDGRISYVIVRILAVTANDGRGNIDKKMSEFAGAAIGDFNENLSVLLQKHGID